MSRKKNTLKDLDEFLKQQASSIVSPEKLQTNESNSALQESPVMKEVKSVNENLAALSREQLYDLIIQTLQGSTAPEDRMLINTALYLKNPSAWKEVIRTYWKNRK